MCGDMKNKASENIIQFLSECEKNDYLWYDHLLNDNMNL